MKPLIFIGFPYKFKKLNILTQSKLQFYKWENKYKHRGGVILR